MGACQNWGNLVEINFPPNKISIDLFQIVVEGSPNDQVDWNRFSGYYSDCGPCKKNLAINFIGCNSGNPVNPKLTFPALAPCSAISLDFELSPPDGTSGYGIDVRLSNLPVSSGQVTLKKLDGIIHIDPDMNGVQMINFQNLSAAVDPDIEFPGGTPFVQNADGSFDIYFRLASNFHTASTSISLFKLALIGQTNFSQGVDLHTSLIEDSGRILYREATQPNKQCGLLSEPAIISIPGSPNCPGAPFVSMSRQITPTNCMSKITSDISTSGGPLTFQEITLEYYFGVNTYSNFLQPEFSTGLSSGSGTWSVSANGDFDVYSFSQINTNGFTISNGDFINFPVTIEAGCVPYYLFKAEGVLMDGSTCSFLANIDAANWPACSPELVGSVHDESFNAAPNYIVTLSAMNSVYSKVDLNIDCELEYNFCPDWAEQPLQVKVETALPDWINGVNTYDLLLIQKHLLGIQPIISPYTSIAADANNSGSITPTDIVELRKLILGIFPNNVAEPWTYVSDKIGFPVPFNFTGFDYGTCNLEDVPPNGVGFNGEFFACKTGDIDMSYTACKPAPIVSREVEHKIQLSSEDEIIYLDIINQSDRDAIAIQGGYLVSDDKVEFVKVIPNYEVGIEDYNYFYDEEKKEFRYSWFPLDGETGLPSSTKLFTLVFRKKHDFLNSKKPVLKTSDMVTENLVFKNDGQVEQITSRWNTINSITSAENVDIYPNPTIENWINLSFSMEDKSNCTIQLLDATGKLVTSFQTQAQSGYNSVRLDGLTNEGLYFIVLETVHGRSVHKITKQ